jgi:hypothetical protein
MGRPVIPAPDGFEEVYVALGWEARDALGIRTSRFKRLLSDDLKRKRRNYVLGNKLSYVPKTAG